VDYNDALPVKSLCWFNGALVYSTEQGYSDGHNDGNDIITMSINPNISNEHEHTLIGIGCGGNDTIISTGGLVTVLIGDSGDIYNTMQSNDVIHKLGNVNANSNGLANTNSSKSSSDYIIASSQINGRTIAIGGAGDDHIAINAIGGDVTVCGDHCRGAIL
jgi:hypothetical protein